MQGVDYVFHVVALKAMDEIKIDPLIQFLEPFGFTDYVNLQTDALCTVSDSGTINEESAQGPSSLKVPS